MTIKVYLRLTQLRCQLCRPRCRGCLGLLGRRRRVVDTPLGGALGRDRGRLEGVGLGPRRRQLALQLDGLRAGCFVRLGSSCSQLGLRCAQLRLACRQLAIRRRQRRLRRRQVAVGR